MKRYIVVPLAVVMAGAMAGGCTKQPLDNLSNEESRIYITNHDSTTNFSSFRTFSVSDSVAVIGDNQPGRKRLDSTDRKFIAAVTSALLQRGYTQVARTAHP